jgi:hypothetical protein
MQSDFIELYSSTLEDQITFVVSVLESASIQYIVRRNSHAGIPQAAIPLCVSVKKKDIKVAQNLLTENILK